MSPVTHFLTGWIVANGSSQINSRERAIITLAGIAPDLDGLGIIPELLTRDSATPLLWYSQYHHLVGHNLLFGLLLAFIAYSLSVRKAITVMLTILSFHLHLLSDLVGSRGADGYQWPIVYLWPFTNSWQWSWSGQWELNAWPNYVVTIAGLVVVFWLAWKRGYSPLEMISKRVDDAFVRTLRRRFPIRA
jgi:inner membrane protein